MLWISPLSPLFYVNRPLPVRSNKTTECMRRPDRGHTVSRCRVLMTSWEKEMWGWESLDLSASLTSLQDSWVTPMMAVMTCLCSSHCFSAKMSPHFLPITVFFSVKLNGFLHGELELIVKYKKKEIQLLAKQTQCGLVSRNGRLILKDDWGKLCSGLSLKAVTLQCGVHKVSTSLNCLFPGTLASDRPTASHCFHWQTWLWMVVCVLQYSEPASSTFW